VQDHRGQEELMPTKTREEFLAMAHAPHNDNGHPERDWFVGLKFYHHKDPEQHYAINDLVYAPEFDKWEVEYYQIDADGSPKGQTMYIRSFDNFFGLITVPGINHQYQRFSEVE
jgi:hypothetical protein